MSAHGLNGSPLHGDDVLLTRDEFAAALKEAGVPFAASTLSSMKVRGSGPPIVMVGRLPLYPLSPGLAWAKARTFRNKEAA